MSKQQYLLYVKEWITLLGLASEKFKIAEQLSLTFSAITLQPLADVLCYEFLT